MAAEFFYFNPNAKENKIHVLYVIRYYADDSKFQFGGAEGWIPD